MGDDMPPPPRSRAENAELSATCRRSGHADGDGHRRGHLHARSNAVQG